MGTGKTYSTKYLLDSNNSSGVAGQVLSTTSTGIDWVDANTVPGSGLWLANGNDIYNSNSGNVGIGTTSPVTKLHISGSTGAASGIRQSRTGVRIWKQEIDSSGRLTWGYLSSESGSTTQTFTLDDNGNVGIGVSNPETSRLLVRGSTNDSTSQIFQAASLAGATRYAVRPDGDNKWYKSDNSLSMTLTSAGNVGIGISNPVSYGKFVVQGTGNLINANASSGAATFQLYEGGQGRFAITTLNGSAGAKFELAGSETMRITSAGAISFGSTGTAYGTSGQILKSNGNASPTWVAASTVIGGPYLPLSAGSSFPLTGDLYTGTFAINTRRLNISSFTAGAGLVMNYGNATGTVEFISLQSNGVTSPIKVQMRQSPNESDLILAGSSGNGLTLTSASNALFAGKVAVNGTSIFADAELDVLGDITLINRNWALRGYNSNTDFVIEKVVGNSFNDNNIALTVTGGQKFVGIGTTNPLNRLVVSGIDTNAELNGTTVTQAALQLSNSDFAYGTFFGTLSSGTGLIQQRRQASAVYYPLAINPYGGNVAIGITSNTTHRLIVSGGSNIASFRSEGSGQNLKKLSISTGGDRVVLDASTTTDAVTAFAFQTGGSEKMRIDSSGNVGIGITGPLGRLHMADDDGPTSLYISNNDTAQTGAGDVQNAIIMKGLYWSGSATSQLVETRINSVHQLADGNGGSALTFMTQTGGSGVVEQVRIDRDGNVGIGTSTPLAKLDVRGSAGGYLKFDTTGSNSTIKSDYNLQLYADDTGDNSSPFANMQFFTAGANERMRITSAGNVGIGTTSPDFKLDVEGTFGVYDLPGNVTSTSVLVRNETIGSEILSNPDFATNTIWGGSGSIANGQLTKTGGGLAYQTYSGLSSGAMYLVEVDVASIAGTANFYLGGTNSSALIVGKQSFYQLGGSANTLVGFNNGYLGSTGSVFNSVSLKLVTSASDQIQTRQLSSDAFGPGNGPYLPLAGGTLTGGLTGTTGTFSGNVNVSGDIEIDNTSGDPFLKLKTSAQEYVLRIDQSDSEKLQIRNTTSGVTALSIDTSQNATFAGEVLVNGGLKVVGPGSYNTFKSGNDYTLGFLDSAGTTQWWIKAYTNGDFALHENGAGDKFTIEAGGNVGIGTTSPGNLLDVAGDTDISGQLFVQHSGSYTAKLKQLATSMSNATYTFEIDSTAHVSNMSTAGAMSVDVDSGRAFTINGLGNVGIGTNSPTNDGSTANTLEVRGKSGTGGGVVRVSNAGNTAAARFFAGSASATIGTVTNHDFNIATNNSVKMVVEDGGNVGINVTNPSEKLHVVGNIFCSLKFGNLVVGTSGVQFEAATAATQTCRFDSDEMRFFAGGGAGEVFTMLNSTGATTFTSTVTATNFILSSDERLKENIKTLEPKAISAKWKSFNVKKDNSYRTGVIAQELEVEHPEFVETNDKGFKSVKYIDLLISKIAELEARLEKAGI